MKTTFLTILSILIICYNILPQISNQKKQAIELGKKGNYTKAIELLEHAKIENQNDAEVYYYLGYFTHYLAYDSRPLIGYNINYSDKVIDYLHKAIQLKPDYGDAYYFIQAEFGARALKALQEENSEAYISAYKEAYEKKSLPSWLIEFGRNILKSCDDDAILFAGGDADFNPIQYLQLVENFRKDVTVIPIAFLNRPWYVEKLRTGFEEILKSVPISLTREQIFDMHPYKWDTLTAEIQISTELKEEFHFEENEIMKWELSPNLKSDNRPYLDAGTAVLANIIETNKWKRPIHFSLGCNLSSLAGLDKYTQIKGVTFKLLPFKTGETKFKIYPDKIAEVLLDPDNIKNFKDVEQHNIPRVSNILINYYGVLYRLALHYKEENQPERINDLIKFVDKYLTTRVLPNSHNIINSLKKLKTNE